MKEWTDIVNAFEELCAAGKPAALVTVVSVEGSAYRRPGARMLVAEDGRTWGGVSGGCLERDVARRARGVIASGEALRCRYDTADEDLHASGVSTGCGGAIELFIEPVDRNCPGPLTILSKVVRERATATIRTSTGFVEHLSPPQSLVIFGAGPDVVPLVAIAKVLGWYVTVVGSRPATAIAERFAQADALRITGPDDPIAGVELTCESAIVVMTHNLARDQMILSDLRGPFRYLGQLGPRHRTRKLLAELPDETVAGMDAERFFNPVGLDLGARSPEEIALAIIAEIQATLRTKNGRSLRNRRGSRPVRHTPEADGKLDPDSHTEGMLANSQPKRCSCPA